MTSHRLTNQLQVIDARRVRVGLIVLHKYCERSAAGKLGGVELDDRIRTEILGQHGDHLRGTDAVDVVEVHVHARGEQLDCFGRLVCNTDESVQFY